MKLAVDAMGGDHAPESVVKGSLKALDTYADLEIIIYGDEEKIRAFMDKNHDRLTIHHTDEKIESDDVPTRAVRRKKQASMVLAVQAVKDKEADAAVSAGNTGALMTAGLLMVGRTEGIERPALAPMLPTMDGSGFLLLDVGANMEAKPSHLLQYAQMGDVYMRNVRGIEHPRIGLLNVGDEAGKGTELTKAVYDMLAASGLNFVGNVEARELLNGPADVVVCDGFTGNVVLKTIEGTAMSLFGLIREELTSSLKTKLAAGVLKPSFKQIKTKMDYAEYGGAGLFGLNAPVIKAHGSSDAQAYFSALRQARTLVLENVADTIKENAAALHDKEESADE